MAGTEEEMQQNEEEDLNDVNMEEPGTSNTSKTGERKPQVYLPGNPLQEGEELVCDESAYILLREIQTGLKYLFYK